MTKKAPVQEKLEKVYDIETLDANHTLIQQRMLFQKHSRNNTSLVIGINSGFLPLFRNFICSVQQIDPKILEYTVIWALDPHVKQTLESMQDLQLQQILILDLPQFQSIAKFRQAPSPEYFEMMAKRPKFFIYLLEQIQINFIFADSDLVFMRDPFSFLHDNDGLGSEVFGKMLRASKMWTTKPQGLLTRLWHWISFQPIYSDERFKAYDAIYDKTREFEQDPLLEIPPDVVYSLDPRRALPFLRDPFESGSKVPKICGGLFYAKSTPKTIELYKHLESIMTDPKMTSLNDQSGIDYIFEHLMKTQLVGRLPRCLQRNKTLERFCPEQGLLKVQVNQEQPDPEAIKIRILDIYQFGNPSVLTDFTGPSAMAASLESTATHEYYRILHEPHFSKNRAFPSKIPLTRNVS
ncbi:hypothetical protein EDD86DRAFT_249428 [Gorgonomyces haynaldii]|nr:hypothetical protein EDD86DRAFT_249428 [Gorgonomyces haynaldii]